MQWPTALLQAANRGDGMDTITGTAAGVPFTALPPAGAIDGPAPLMVTWHMLDAPRTDAAFAAALPMTGVPAWRVHLGMPMCGARMVDGRVDAVIALAREDALLAFLAPFVHQAADEFPAALTALRDQLPVDDEPVGPPLGSSRASPGTLTGGPRRPVRPPTNWTSSPGLPNSRHTTAAAAGQRRSGPPGTAHRRRSPCRGTTRPLRAPGRRRADHRAGPGAPVGR